MDACGAIDDDLDDERRERLFSAFINALIDGERDLAMAVLNFMPDCSKASRGGHQAVLWACTDRQNNAVLEAMLKLDRSLANANDPLSWAVDAMNVGAAKTLVSHGAVPRQSHLFSCAMRGDGEMARFLISVGLDPNLSIDGKTPKSIFEQSLSSGRSVGYGNSSMTEGMIASAVAVVSEIDRDILFSGIKQAGSESEETKSV